ncbi:MAG: oligosaccharide flippase family protein [Bacteroidota bacterium]|nr:MAG: oligosaccharide flippase family protein [Bacteroidota bacterium]
MLNNSKKKIQQHKTIVKNFSYLTLLRFFSILLPLITYPYLIKVLGTSLYGKVIFVQTIISYFSIIIQFGFNNSATKEVAINRDDISKLDIIVSSIFQIKFILWVLSLSFLILYIYIVPGAKSDKWLYLFSFGICFDELLFPQWFFQGLEKMGYITAINLFAKLIFVGLIFFIVKNENDYLWVPILYSIGALMGGILSLYFVFRKEGIRFIFQPYGKLIYFVKESFLLFVSNIFISVKDKFNIIFLGIFLGMESVAIYDLGIKIMNLFLHPVILVNDAIFPKVAKEKDMRFVLKTIKLLFIFTLIITGIFQFVTPLILKFFIGEQYLKAVAISRILLISPLLFSISYSLSRNCLIVLGKYNYLLYSITITSTFYLALIGVGYVFNLLNNTIIFATITVLVFLFEMTYRIYITLRLKLI